MHDLTAVPNSLDLYAKRNISACLWGDPLMLVTMYLPCCWKPSRTHTYVLILHVSAYAVLSSHDLESVCDISHTCRALSLYEFYCVAPSLCAAWNSCRKNHTYEAFPPSGNEYAPWGNHLKKIFCCICDICMAYLRYGFVCEPLNAPVEKNLCYMYHIYMVSLQCESVCVPPNVTAAWNA
jgi:hypothetical protein